MLSPVNAELGGLPLTWRRLLMAEKSFTDTLEEKLAFISPTVKAIEFGGDQPYQSRLGKFGQRDKWSFCLTAARMAAEQEKR
jgi:hypothetical protein